MMAEGLSDAAAADGGNDDDDRSGGQFDTSADAEFSLSTQPPSIGHRSKISVAMNHPAAAARRAKKPLPPRQESPGRNCKRTNANAVGGCLPPRPRLPPRPPSLPPRPPIRSTTPLAPRKSPPVDDDLIVIVAGDDGSRHESVGGRRLSSVAEVAGEDGSRHDSVGGHLLPSVAEIAGEDGSCHDHGGGKLLPPVRGRYWFYHLLIQVMTKYFLCSLLSRILCSCMATVCCVIAPPTSLDTMTPWLIRRRTTKSVSIRFILV